MSNGIITVKYSTCEGNDSVSCIVSTPYSVGNIVISVFSQNKVLEPHLIAAALLSLKFSTPHYDTATTRYSDTSEI